MSNKKYRYQDLSTRDRLNLILQGRKLTPWARSLGLSGGIINTLSDGKLPRAETLALIQRIENVSSSWLIDGSGSPFMTYIMVDELETENHLRMLLEEVSWNVYWITSFHRCAIVLQQPAQIETNITIDYNAVEIMIGPIDGSLLGLLYQYCEHYKRPIKELIADRATMNRFQRGDIGNYELFEEPGLIHRLQSEEKKMLVQEPVDTQYSTNHPLIGFDKLDDHDQITINLIVQALIDARHSGH
jgi:hypothetical protein